MNYKIDIVGTSIALNVSRNDITVTNGITYDIQILRQAGPYFTALTLFRVVS